MTPEKSAPAAKPKPPKPDPTLGEILSGVDIIGTILHLDLPRMEKELLEIKTLVSSHPAASHSNAASVETASALEELKELVQLQGERLASLERRLAHLTTLCESWEAASRTHP